MLQIRNLRKSFGDLQVLKSIDLDVNKGDVVAILGPSGSGKTTMLRCLNFLEKSDGGTMLFDDRRVDLARVTHAEANALRRRTGFVFQSYNLFANKTALQNVTEGLIIARKMPRRRAEEIARWSRSAWMTAPTTTPASFPAGSSSAWRLPAPWPPTRRSSILTSLRPLWTPS